jgi:hypothetical protein
MNKVKILLAIPRKKDNENVTCESMQHRKVFKRVWSEPDEREKRLNELRAISKCYPEYNWRIYEFELLLSALNINVKEKYETPSGVHFLVTPFDIRQINNFKKDWNTELHKDGLRFVEMV